MSDQDAILYAKLQHLYPSACKARAQYLHVVGQATVQHVQVCAGHGGAIDLAVALVRHLQSVF